MAVCDKIITIKYLNICFEYLLGHLIEIFRKLYRVLCLNYERVCRKNVNVKLCVGHRDSAKTRSERVLV